MACLHLSLEERREAGGIGKGTEQRWRVKVQLRNREIQGMAAMRIARLGRILTSELSLPPSVDAHLVENANDW
jgi:hypothetical protein